VSARSLAGAATSSLAPRWLQSWLRPDRSPQSGAIVLAHRRVYILPVAHGNVFMLVLLVMLAGSINYSLSLGFVLTFLLAGLAINGILYTFRNLANLRVNTSRPRSVFLGQLAEFPLRIENPSNLPRASIEISGPGLTPQVVDVPARDEVSVMIAKAAEQRGLMPIGRVMLLTRFPLGLFRAWSYLHFDAQCIVYPQPEDPPVPLPAPSGERGEGAASAMGTEDYAGLRPYQAGDSPRSIAWKADAREQGLLTKVFSGRAETHLWLDWSQLPNSLEPEARLSRLTRWVLDADALDCAFGLRLPGFVAEPGSGVEHRTRCLDALALYEHEPKSRLA
jgi:uncharacterized protein (DUF58 family)